HLHLHPFPTRRSSDLTVFATRTVAADLVTKVPTVGQVASFWTNLVNALLYTHGGLLGNWLILGLGLSSVFALRFRERFERLLIRSEEHTSELQSRSDL